MSSRIVLAAGLDSSPLRLSLLLLCLAGGAERATAEVELDAPIALEVTANSSDLALGDFDEDGLVDAVMLRFQQVYVHLGITPQGIREVVTLSRPGSGVDGWGFDPIIADFDSDGHADILVRSLHRCAVSIHHGDGRGRFGEPLVVSPNLDDRTRSQVAIADFDQDGDLDFAMADGTRLGIHLLLGSGDGGFTEGPFIPLGDQPIWMSAGSFNADGAPDLAVLLWQPTRVVSLLGDGLGGFRSAGSFAPVSDFAVMETGDLDRDGRDEIFVAESIFDPNTATKIHTLKIVAADEFGALSVASERTSALGVLDLSPVDLEGDGNLDVAMLTDDELQLLVGDGTRRPGNVTPLADRLLRGEFDFYDVNGDGALDLVRRIQSSRDHISISLATRPGRFNGPRTIEIGVTPGRHIIADFNADGFDDIVNLSRANGFELSIVLGMGRGRFSEPTSLGWPFIPQDMAAADFNHDGSLDLLFCSTVTDSIVTRVSLWLGDGSGGFNPSAERLRAAYGLTVHHADVNGDGNEDAIVQSPTGDGSFVLIGDGRGDFVSEQRISSGYNETAITSGDFNEDGADEVVTAVGGRLEIYAGSATFRFDRLDWIPTGFPTQVVRAALVDCDPHLDLVVLGGQPDESLVLLGDGNGAFVPVRNCPLGGGNLSAVLEDFDGDGLIDVVTAPPGLLRAATGDGLGGFGRCVNYAASGGPELAASDVDQDGHVDLVGPGRGDQTLSVIRNRAFLYPRFAFWRGAVNAGAGEDAITDVLFVNDSAGGKRRTIDLVRHQPLIVSVAPPPAATMRSPFALYAWRDRPTADSSREFPFGVGTTCLPTPLHGGTPRVVWNNTGRIALGAPTRPSKPAPSTLIELRSGLGREATFFLQGVIADPASAGTRPASVTNAILVEVR